MPKHEVLCYSKQGKLVQLRGALPDTVAAPARCKFFSNVHTGVHAVPVVVTTKQSFSDP